MSSQKLSSNDDLHQDERPDKRRRILNGALRAFARKGFYNTRISEVAAESGVADGTIYLYFKNKDDLLIRLFEDRMEWLIDRLSNELAVTIDTFEEKFKVLIWLHISLAHYERELAEFMTVELRQSAKFVKEYKNPKFQDYLGIINDLILAGQAEGTVRPGLDAKLAARLLFGSLDEALLSLTLSKATDKKTEAKKYTDFIYQTFLHGFLK